MSEIEKLLKEHGYWISEIIVENKQRFYLHFRDEASLLLPFSYINFVTVPLEHIYWAIGWCVGYEGYEEMTNFLGNDLVKEIKEIGN